MTLGTRQPKLLYALVGALVALLLGLAALQYHWLGEVSRGERERMQSNLNASLKQFALDFDRELTRLFLAFQTDIRTETEPADLYAARYRNWRENASDARLVRDVYLLGRDAGKGWKLACYQENITFTPCAWPENLTALRQRVENPPEFQDEVRRVINKNGKTEMINIFGALPMQHAMTDPDIPALIVPADNPLGREAGLPPPSFDHSSKYFVIVLDMDYLKREFIPQLAQKHDFSGPMSVYRLTVANARDDAKIVYQPNADNATGAGDAAANLFSIRLEEFDNLLVKPANGQAAPSLKSAQRVTINIYKGKTELKSTEEVAPAFAAKLGENPGWRAAVQHRSGSLDAAVALVRRRNLSLSAAILALLGVSLALIVRASQRAQLLAARQMGFVAGVSHELRTPLAVICSAAENLADGVIQRQEQTQRYGALIRDEGRRLGGLVEQVLEFAGAQSGRQAYDLRPVALRDVLHNALTPYRVQLAEHFWRVETNLPEDLPLIKADAPALTRAVQNLIGNALKYGDAGRFLRLSAAERDGFVALTVADKGRGIPANELRHIFEPFQRGREAVAEQIHGNGLGLSLVKHIANAHGGRVEVTSQVNEGSAFTIYVPVAAQVSTQSGSDGVGLMSR